MDIFQSSSYFPSEQHSAQLSVPFSLILSPSLTTQILHYAYLPPSPLVLLSVDGSPSVHLYLMFNVGDSLGLSSFFSSLYILPQCFLTHAHGLNCYTNANYFYFISWFQTHYFPELLTQISNSNSSPSYLSLHFPGVSWLSKWHHHSPKYRSQETESFFTPQLLHYLHHLPNYLLNSSHSLYHHTTLVQATIQSHLDCLRSLSICIPPLQCGMLHPCLKPTASQQP